MTYNAGTLTAYVVPSVPLQATFGTGAIYLIAVSGSLDDNTEYPNPGTQTLGSPYYNTFSLLPQSMPTNTSPLTILQQNGSDVSTPGNGSFTPSTIGYGTITMTEAVDPTSLGPYSVTLIPRKGGTDPSNLDAADIPVNAVVTFNPNTNQFVIVPTVPLGSDIYLYTLSSPSSSQMKATNGDALLNAPLYETFDLSFSQGVSYVMTRHHPTPGAPAAGGTPPNAASPTLPIVIGGGPTPRAPRQAHAHRGEPARRHDLPPRRVPVPTRVPTAPRRFGPGGEPN